MSLTALITASKRVSNDNEVKNVKETTDNYS